MSFLLWAMRHGDIGCFGDFASKLIDTSNMSVTSWLTANSSLLRARIPHGATLDPPLLYFVRP